MKSAREDVSIALFKLLREAYPFAKTSRRPTLPENVVEGDQPYMGLELLDEDDQQPEMNLTVYNVHYRVYVYVQSDPDPDVTAESKLNDILDAIDEALSADEPGERQSLGGLVQNASISGVIPRSNGLTDAQAWMIIPIVVLSGI